MKLTLTIDLDAFAFADGANGEDVARVMRKHAALVDQRCVLKAGDGWPVLDVNGNRVGEIRVMGDETEV